MALGPSGYIWFGAVPEDEHDQDGGHGAAGQRQRAVQPVLPGLLPPPADAARRDRQPGKFGRALFNYPSERSELRDRVQGVPFHVVYPLSPPRGLHWEGFKA